MTRLGVLRALACLLTACLQNAPAFAEALRPFTQGSWQALTGAQKAEPVIVHFWGLTCGPCLAELSEWGEFAARHPRVRIILVNWDRRAQEPAHISATLAKAGLARVESWALADPFEEKLRFNIDRDWLGELPRTQLIGRNGSVTAFSGPADFAQLAAWLAGERAR